MRKIKKITSVILAVLLVCSVTTVSFGSVSAIIDTNGCYAPGDNVEETYRYYFAMPDDWYSSNTDTAGVYWWTGTDACGAIDGTGGDVSWPGYKAQRGDIENLYYIDCPTDVYFIIWNNYINGGTDKNAPIYSAAKQANDARVEGYCDGDSDLYTTEWFEEMYKSFKGDKAKLGAFADNFFYDLVNFDDEGFESFTFKMDNMIFVIDPSQTSETFEGKMAYIGEWYFYYGNGEYGIYPTRKEAAEKCVLYNMNSGSETTIPSVTTPIPVNPTTPAYTNGEIHFDVKKSGWDLNTNKKFYCHIWRTDGSGLWPEWQTRSEQCTLDKETGIATYDLSKTKNTISHSDGKVYCVIFSSNTGMQTYNAIMSGACIGDTMYCTGEQIENPEDSEKKANVAVWENNPDCGSEKKITSRGNIVGSALPDGESDESLLANYLICYYNDPAKTDLTQSIINKLNVAPIDVYVEVLNRCGDSRIIRVIANILSECTDPTDDIPILKTDKITLGVGEKIKIDVYSSDNKKITDLSNYGFYVDNSKIASISSDGTITAKKTGSTYFTVVSPRGRTVDCSLNVKAVPTSVKVNPTSIMLGVGEKLTISESTNSGSYANASNIVWSSSDNSVATVTKGSANKAVVTAKGTGTAYIKTKLYNGKTATCKVTVKPAPISVKVNPTSVTLGKGESYTISEGTNSGSYANASNLVWSSSNNSVATVTKGSGNKAVIKAMSFGTAYVTISLYNGKAAVCKVTVKSAPTSVKLSSSSVTLGKGESYTISESTDSGSYANASNLKWASSNTKVATVTKGSGNKATIKATGIGTAYVKITLYNGKIAQCKVMVKNAPTSVKLSASSVTLGNGESYTISEGTNSGSYANASNLKWSSSNTKVATVTKGSGNKATIKATGIGTAYVKITLYNGKTAQCKVTVKNAPTSVSLSKTNLTLNKGASYTISEGTNSGSYANASNLKWSSSNTSVATVTKGNGNKAVIKANAKGTAYIKITLYNGKTAQCKVTVK